MKTRTRKLILLVDDNPDDIDLTLRAFRKTDLPCEFVVARDGVEALAYLQGSHSSMDLPQFVLLDLKLPRMDGLEVLRQVREDPRTRLVPVVMLTSSTEPDDITRCYVGGANSYIKKPVDFNEFIETIQRLGVYWLMINEAL
jgi:CheY-like chemotaxis protein